MPGCYFAVWLILTALLGSHTRQCVVVTTPQWSSTTGSLQRYARYKNGWEKVGNLVPVALGRSGLAWGRGLHPSQPGKQKREGDGCSPAGIFQLSRVAAFSREEIGLPPGSLPFLQITPETECVDDVASSHYGQILKRGQHVDWKSSEAMRKISEYRIAVVLDYHAGVGGGSCIFLHIWDGPGESTSGCTAMPADDMRALARWLRRDSRPLLVQMPAAEYQSHRQVWRLP